VKRALALKDEKLLPFEKLRDGYDAAVQRAQELRRAAASTGQPRRNPSTNVDELTERIRKGSK
jgi:hypothetical protein